jgi:hypothetical protein
MDRDVVRKRHEFGNNSLPNAGRDQPTNKPDRLLSHLALASVLLLLEIELRAFVRACNAA